MRYAYDAPGRRRVRVPFRASVFKGATNAADVYVSYGLPVARAPEPEAKVVDVTRMELLLRHAALRPILAPAEAAGLSLGRPPC